MADPTLQVQIAFATNPTSAPTWTDVTNDVRSFSIKRGRQHELDRIEAGSLTLVLDNRDRRFDPTYVSGPYYGNVLPLRKVQISATFGGVTYDLFTGFIQAWPMTTPGAFDNLVTLTADDGLKVLGYFKLNNSYAQQLTGARVNAILNDASWTTGNSWILGDATSGVLGSTTIVGPNADRAVDSGVSTVQAQTFTATTASATTALKHLQDVQLVENGLMYVDGRGIFVFKDRQALNTSNKKALATFGNGFVPYYGSPTYSYDDQYIYNQIWVTPTGAANATILNDAASQSQYFVRTKDWSNLPLQDVNGNEVPSLANWLLRTYKQPQLRVTKVSLRPHDDSVWPQILGREIGDLITVNRTPQSLPGGSTISVTCRIGQINHKFDKIAASWQTDWGIEAADLTTYWILGDAAQGVLGMSTIPAY